MKTQTAADSSPIDIVIAWVDGDDPAHRARRMAFDHLKGDMHSEAVKETRFTAFNEIYVAVASALKYLPFIRTIWIVTDQQRPEHIDAFAKAGLCAPDKIKIVDHRDILGDIEGALPTFNSLTIEAALWRIPGLAPRYIYMNDDFMFLTPLTEADFFDGDKLVLRGTYKLPNHRRPKMIVRRFLRKITFRPPNNRPSFRIAQELGARAAGDTELFVHFGHWPHPQFRDIQAEFHAANPDVLPRQVRHRFRSVEQYNGASLTNHLVGHDALLPEPPMAYIRPMPLDQMDQAIDDFLGNDCMFGCMQSLDEIDEARRTRLLSGLAERFKDFLPVDILKLPRPHGADEKEAS